MTIANHHSATASAHTCRVPLAAPGVPKADTVTDWSFEASIRLAAQGVYASDRSDHRAQRIAQAAQKARIEKAYSDLGLDRSRVHERIGAALAPYAPGGCWPWSWGLHGSLCRRVDEWVQGVAVHSLELHLDTALRHLPPEGDRSVLRTIYRELGVVAHLGRRLAA